MEKHNFLSSIRKSTRKSAFSFIGVLLHAHQLKDCHYPQVSKNVILSKKLARKADVFYESFDSR
ncbi:hypothetical protein ELS81_29720 [Bacillus sp. VKPM B-3276]|nr:hypothetical protein BK736_09690 [Bacillus thuringiensis serovar poloniensis]RUR59476.1 hypothetical protein ELS81_29720 [Bacillus sp. VKPM B-3276]